jgi:hypothetical protein
MKTEGRWQFTLVLIGLLVFGAITYHSFKWNREWRNGRPSRYFYWGSIRLDSDPLNQRPISPVPARPCSDPSEGCVAWDPETIWVEPGIALQAYFWAALPAFATGAGVVYLFARLGLSQVITFMATMPVLIALWFWFVGWSIDRWNLRRRQAASSVR